MSLVAARANVISEGVSPWCESGLPDETFLTAGMCDDEFELPALSHVP